MPKSTSPFAQRKSAPSPLSTAKRKKSATLSQDKSEERLYDTGIVPNLAPRGVSQDVNNLIRYIHAHMWEPIPERASGMNSERISEILRFRETLPRIVSIAHLHALSASTTETERELARLVARSAVRKVIVPGRGKGGAAVGEGIVLTEDWTTSLRENVELDDEVKEKYIALLTSNPGSATVSTSSLTSEEVRTLVSTGYFTNPTALSSNLGNLFSTPTVTGSLSSVALAGTKAATGTLAAIGGYGAVQDAGGGGSTLATSSTRPGPNQRQNQILAREMTLSLPSTGVYLKLLLAARQHLLSLLKQTSPRFKETTYTFLKEKWEGNTLNDAASRAKRARGEWSGVLPGKTRQWREFWGLRFEWVLAECMGAGVVEVFETGVGVWGVRGI